MIQALLVFTVYSSDISSQDLVMASFRELRLGWVVGQASLSKCAYMLKSSKSRSGLEEGQKS